MMSGPASLAVISFIKKIDIENFYQHKIVEKMMSVNTDL